MRANVNATIVVAGNTTIPVGVATAVKKVEKEFRTLHRECGTPINVQSRCAKCEKALEGADVTKGFEYTKGTFLMLEPEELDAITSDPTKIIEIGKFVKEADIAAFVEKDYHLIPNANIVMPYVLLRNAMEANALAGLGASVLWGKETPCAIRATRNGITLSMLYCADEVRSAEEIRERISIDVKPKEQKLADMLVREMVEPFEAETDLVSKSRLRVEQYIASKLAGTELPTLISRDVPVYSPDLAASLRESIDNAKAAKRARKTVMA